MKKVGRSWASPSCGRPRQLRSIGGRIRHSYFLTGSRGRIKCQCDVQLGPLSAKRNAILASFNQPYMHVRRYVMLPLFHVMVIVRHKVQVVSLTDGDHPEI